MTPEQRAREKAIKVLGECFAVDENGDPLFMRASAVGLIAAALLAEREAALKTAEVIAQNMSTEALDDPHEIWIAGFEAARVAFLAAIRALGRKG